MIPKNTHVVYSGFGKPHGWLTDSQLYHVVSLVINQLNCMKSNYDHRILL